MLDLKLTDIFSTICVGILSVSLVLYFHFILNKFFGPKFDGIAFVKFIKIILIKNYKESGYAILFLVVVYCFGIIFGDLTERMSDSDDTNKNCVLRELKWVSQLKQQGDARRETLLCDTDTIKLTPLGFAIFRSTDIVNNANRLAETKFFSDSITSVSKQLDSLNKRINFLNDRDSITKVNKLRLDFNRFLQQIYYSGKNWTYAKGGEPLEELKSIQNRIDLSRSMVLLTTLGLQLLFLVIIANLFVLRKNLTHKKVIVMSDWEKLANFSQCWIFFTFIIILFVSKECYNINESNFNKRAYGYYLSDIQRIDFKTSKKNDTAKK